MKMNWSYYLLSLVFMLTIPFQTAADDFERGDVDQNGAVGIEDVTCLIDYLLSQEWPNGPYDEGYWAVFNMAFGEKYVKLEDTLDSCNHCTAIDVVYPLFYYACQFHFRINGVDYGPNHYMTEPVLGDPYQNPLKPCRNNYVIKVGDEPMSCTFGVITDEETNSYYVYVQKYMFKKEL